MNEEIGTPNIDVVVDEICGIGADLESALTDGKFNIPADLIRFLDDLVRLPAVVRAIPFVDDEFLTLTSEQEDAIVERVKEKLNLPDADVTEVVATAMAALLSTSNTVKKVLLLVAAIKALKHPTE